MKILIFTASAGNGHNSTAKRLKEKIISENSNAEVEIVDVYKSYANKLKEWIMTEGYFFACNHLLNSYNYFFKKGENLKFKNRFKCNASRTNDCLLYGIFKKICDFKPDIIISTYIFASIPLALLKSCYNIPATTISMTLDYGVSPYWECCATGLDKMFITGNYMKNDFLKKGYNENQLITAGIPVAEQFSNLINRNTAANQVGLNPNKFTLLVMKASFFPISNKKLIKELAKIKKPIQIVIVNGKNERIKNKMQKILNNLKTHHQMFNIGYTDKIVEYFNCADLILGKAGGLSTTESINAGIPSLIVNNLPQQEIYNKEFLISHNCALAVTPNTIAQNINNLIDNPKLYDNLKNSCLKLRNFNTLNIYYKAIMECKKADYSNFKINEDKNSVLRNIRKYRKISSKF